MKKKIYVEDEALKSLLVVACNISNKECIISPSIGGVCKKLRTNEKIMGIVDEDPGFSLPDYFRKMELITDEKEGYGIKVYRDKRNNFLLVICPRFEEWTLRCAVDEKINPEKYGLPTDPKKYHGVVNYDLRKTKKLLESLKDSKKMKHFKEIVSELDKQ